MLTKEQISGLVRVCKQQAALAAAPLDPEGLVPLFLAELPIRISRRGEAGRAGRAGFFRPEGRGNVGHVLINVGVCYTEERFAHVLYHELAHAINAWLHAADERERPHGPRWKAVMERLGQPPERCHSYEDRE